MTVNRNPNIRLLEHVVDKLGNLSDDLVFLGGCATGLLLTDPAAPPLWITKDVDVITEVSSRQDYYALAAKLRSVGFSEDTAEHAPICRWRSGDLLLDVMPTNPDLLGFGSIWYKLAFDTAEKYQLPSGQSIRVISAPCFLACKLTAFDSRGGRDPFASHDMEDIIALLDGRPEIVQEIRNASTDLKSFVSNCFGKLLENDRIEDIAAAHLPADKASQARGPIILDRIREICN